jgi:sugar-phosphatase
MILFDLDGVLVDSTTPVRRSWRAWAAAHDLPAEAVEAATHGRRTVDTVRQLAPRLDAARVAAELEAAQAADLAGVVATAGAGELLAGLRPGEWAVVTSGSRPLALARLGAAGLPEPDLLVTGDDVRAGKPDPEGYLRAAAAAGREPASCLVVEDAPTGVAAARAAGMPVIAVAADPADPADPAGLAGADAVAGSCAQFRVTRPRGGGLELRVLDPPPE